MNFDYTPEDQEFLMMVRKWLAEHLPADLQYKVLHHQHLEKADYRRWHKIMAEQGWVAPYWPKEWGGTGWTPVQCHLFEEECARAGTLPILPFGINMVAPVIMRFGSEAQKRHFLPRIYDGTDWWCQGYSEPSSGSDLASLRTRAVREGNEYVVNGQKTWNTLGQHADWIFCLVRTDPEAKQQEGISFLLIDMRSKGVSVAPIITFDGSHEVNDVFFDNVRVPAENLIGQENKGWTYAKYLLGHERTGIAGVGRSKRELEFLKKIAQKEQLNGHSLMDDLRFACKVAEVEIDLMALEITVLRVLSSATAGHGPGPEASMLKVKGSEIQQRLTELMVEVLGPMALPSLGRFAGTPTSNFSDSGAETLSVDERNTIDPIAAYYFNFRKTTIYGGSNEIQKNIMTKMVLGL